MDESKDIQRTDNLSHFLQYNVRINPFGQNVSAERMYRRAERAILALHLLTNHIPKDEPGRIEGRKVGFTVLSSIVKLSEEMRAPTSTAFQHTQESIRRLISIVRTYSTDGYVSIQNATILIEALDELGNFLTVSQRSPLSEATTLSKDDLLGTDTHVSILTSRKVAPSTPTRVIRDNGNTERAIKDNTDIERTIRNSNEQSLSRRSLSILDILKSQGAIGIKDIAANLPEYSEKMIQRELAHLIEEGQVKKLGFKRWSKYDLSK
ncbi:hypothetical protein C4585_01800 [Candidatus Parcubacteria bacterium]|nr:MAG: hypothetical protein C4585_01800 [Candidatus Parcubacteria bacterium]